MGSTAQLVQGAAGSGGKSGSIGNLLREMPWADLGVPLGVLGIVMAMIMPLPSFLLDVLISANITFSVIIMMVSLHITKPVELNVFPTTLLLTTLFRLALNISSSRLILLNGNSGTSAAARPSQLRK